MWRRLLGACVRAGEPSGLAGPAAPEEKPGERGCKPSASVGPPNHVFAGSTAESSCCGSPDSPFQDAASLHHDSSSSTFPLDALLPSSCSRGGTNDDTTSFPFDIPNHTVHDSCNVAPGPQPLAAREALFPAASAPPQARLCRAVTGLGRSSVGSVGYVTRRSSDSGQQRSSAFPSSGHVAPVALRSTDRGPLHVALSASNIRDIAAADPAMRIRQLKLLSYGPGTVVFKGGWQGLLVAVKFTLCRWECGAMGDDSGGPDGRVRQVSEVLATHCMPQRTSVARVYACDASEVVPASHSDDPRSALRGLPDAPREPSRYGPGPAPLPGLLTVRPCGGDFADPIQVGFAADAPPVHGPHAGTADAEEQEEVGGSSGSYVPPAGRHRRSGPGPARFHFSSVVYSGDALAGAMAAPPARPSFDRFDAAAASTASAGASAGASRNTSASGTGAVSASASDCPGLRSAQRCEADAASPADAANSAHATTTTVAAAAPAPDVSTLAGLLQHLDARPGDLLVHTVMELHTGGNLWHAIRSGVFNGAGPLGPRGAARMLLHSARGVAQGLAQLHAAGHVHGGLTPSNVLLQWGVAREDEGGADAYGSGGGGGGGRRRGTSSGGGGSERTLHRRRSLAARLADCCVRRLALGGGWRRELDSNPELRACTAPEVLAVPAGKEVTWSPSHDVYAFGAVLFSMCTGALPRTHDAFNLSGPVAAATDAAAAAAAPAAAAMPSPALPAVWPQSVWTPLRSLGQACMAIDPAARPSACDVVKTLLLWEQRLRTGSRAHLYHLATPPSPELLARRSLGAGAASAGPVSYPGIGSGNGKVNAEGRLRAVTGAAGLPLPGARSATAVTHVVIAEAAAEGEATSVEVEVQEGGGKEGGGEQG